MAYSPIAFTAPNYRDYKNEWIKAYEPGTTTPKNMATDSTLATFIAKAQLNQDGFIVSAGGALIIPYIDGAYDLWLFPTEAEADANNTSNALRLADNIVGEYGSRLAYTIDLRDKYNLSDGQDITEALTDAFKRYRSISLGDLKNVTLANNTDLSTDRICHTLYVDQAEVKVIGSQVIIAASGDSLPFALMLGSGQFWGDAKHATIAVQTSTNTNEVIVQEGHGFVVGDRMASSFDNTYLPNSTSSGRVINIITGVASNGNGTDTLTTTNNFLRRPNGIVVGSASFSSTGNTITLSKAAFPDAVRVEVGQNFIITGTTSNNVTAKVTAIADLGADLQFSMDEVLTTEVAPSASIDFRGDYPLPVGANVTTADFTRNGIVYYGTGDFLIHSDSANSQGLKNFAGYISDCRDLSNPRGSSLGTASFIGVDFTDSFIDGFKVAKADALFDGVKCLGTLEPGKQGILLDMNATSKTVIRNCKFSRVNKDQDFLWYATSDANDLVQAGDVALSNNTFDGSLASLPYAGTDMWGRGRLTFEKGSFHVFAPFYTAGVSIGNFISNNDRATNYSRAFLSSTRSAKTLFEYKQLAFVNPEFDVDAVLIFEVGVNNTDAARKRKMTVTGGKVAGTQETLNLGCMATYIGTTIYTDAQKIADQGEVTAVAITYSNLQGGATLKGRFKIASPYGVLDKVRVPYTDNTAEVPLFSSTYLRDATLNLILETTDVDVDGYQDINKWFAVNADANAGEPGAPNLKWQWERVGAKVFFGGRDFNQGQYYAELDAEDLDKAPYPVTGRMLHRLPQGSIFRGLADKTERRVVATTRAAIGTSIVADADNPVTSFPVSTAVPYGATHFAVIKVDASNAQNNSTVFYNLDSSGWDTNTATIKGSGTITFNVDSAELIAYYTLGNITAGFQPTRKVKASGTNYDVSVFEGGFHLIVDSTSNISFNIPSGVENEATYIFENLDGPLIVNPPSGWALQGSPTNRVRVFVDKDQQTIRCEDASDGVTDRPNNQTGTAYTIKSSDAGRPVYMNNAAANTVTIDTEANQAIPLNSTILVLMEGAGATTVTAAAGVTLNGVLGGSGALTQYSGVALTKRAANVWVATPLAVA